MRHDLREDVDGLRVGEDVRVRKSLGLCIATAGLAVLAACTTSNEPDDATLAPEETGPETTGRPPAPGPGATEEPEPPESGLPQEYAELVADMVGESSVGWEDYEVISETELRFLSTSGNQACYGQRYQVEETAEEVAVAVIVGTRPDGAQICTQEAIFIAVPVELGDPLGERDVVELEDPELNE